jgi:sugar/nucleoside kinase (ribokinase family)
MDVICRVGYPALEELDVAPGSMNLVDHSRQEEILSACTIARRLAGGSCANTVRAVAFLSAAHRSASGEIDSPVYTGGVGTDETGDAFASLLAKEGVVARLGRKTTPTGRSVILVTPDGQRTMFTFLGACREMAAQDVDQATFSCAKVLHTTGYMWDTSGQEEAARWAMAEARSNGAVVSFDIADPFVVARFRGKLLEWLAGRTDILFANREELAALTGVESDDTAIVEAAFSLSPTVVMKVGERGAYLGTNGSVELIAGFPEQPLDTTGAGDAFAGGYLYGLVTGRDAPASTRIANAIASEIVKVEGCDYQGLEGQAIIDKMG